MRLNRMFPNLRSKINRYESDEISEDLSMTIDSHINNFKRLNGHLKKYLNNNQNHLLHSVPSAILTILIATNEIEEELCTWEKASEKGLLPKELLAKLRATKTQIDQIDESSTDIKKKIESINDAHTAANSLPTDLQSLREAKSEIEELCASAKKEFEETKKTVEILKDSIISIETSSVAANEKILEEKGAAKKHTEEALQLVDQCDDALRICTTQGLAAGFDLKEKELKESMWVWIGGLLIALTVGAAIGADRVDAFTAALANDLTAGQAVLHSIMSLFAIGGPLWLAWISTQQINQRFKLAEDYAYKATVAKSFTGFSKVAERFDEDTEQRLFNSTLDRLDEMPLRLVQGKDYNSPWHEFVDSEAFKTAIETVPSLAREARMFATRTNLKDTTKNTKARQAEQMNL